MTTQSMSYDDVMQMTEDERNWWFEKCDEYQDDQREAAAQAKAGH